MAFNKISFAYVTVAQPAMTDNPQNYVPQILFRNADPDLFQIVIVTVGLLFSSKEPYAIEADVLFDGETVIDPTFSADDKIQIPVYGEPEPGQIVTLSHLQVNGVKFRKSGIYQVKCSIAEDMEKLRKAVFVDTLDSYFYVGVGENEVEKP